jgi:hypothetical protein
VAVQNRIRNDLKYEDNITIGGIRLAIFQMVTIKRVTKDFLRLSGTDRVLLLHLFDKSYKITKPFKMQYIEFLSTHSLAERIRSPVIVGQSFKHIR